MKTIARIINTRLYEFRAIFHAHDYKMDHTEQNIE